MYYYDVIYVYTHLYSISTCTRRVQRRKEGQRQINAKQQKFRETKTIWSVRDDEGCY